MMPLYFPFTAVSPTASERLSACFERIAVYQALDCPLQNKDAMKADNDFLEFLQPVAGDEKKIAAVIKEYKNWIHLHEDAPLAFLKIRSNAIPFFTDTSVSKIRADLKNRTASDAHSENAAPTTADTVFAARLFLAVANEHDVHCFDLLKDMAAQEKMEQALYDRIKGEPGDLGRLFHPPAKSAEEDPGNAMTEQRLRAWSVLLLHDPAPPGVFVTDSPAVMDYLESHGARMEIIFSAENLLVRQDEDTVRGFRKELSDALALLAAGSAISKTVHAPAALPAGSVEETVSLTVAVVPGVNARKYFGGFAPRTAAGTDTGGNTRYVSTVICQVSSPSLF
jgi:hypothetical protein